MAREAIIKLIRDPKNAAGVRSAERDVVLLDQGRPGQGLADNLDDLFERMLTLRKVEEGDCESFSRYVLFNGADTAERIDQACEHVALLRRMDQLVNKRAPSPAKPSTPSPSKPLAPDPGLDEAGRALYAEAQSEAAQRGEQFLVALSRVTGEPGHAKGGDTAPPDITAGLDPARVDQERLKVDRRARELAVREDVGYTDGLRLAEHEPELEAALADTGFSDTPWLDTSQKLLVEPWNDEHWERDRRRAEAGAGHTGMSGFMGPAPDERVVWRMAAEEGRDLAHELADEVRARRRDAVQATHSEIRTQGRQKEHADRTAAVNAELDRRARDRLPGH